MVGMLRGMQEPGFRLVRGWMAVGLPTPGPGWNYAVTGKTTTSHHPFQTVGSFGVVPKHRPSPHSHVCAQEHPPAGSRSRCGSLLVLTRWGVAIAGNHSPGELQPGNALGTSGRGGSLFKNLSGPGGMGAR